MATRRACAVGAAHLAFEPPSVRLTGALELELPAAVTASKKRIESRRAQVRRRRRPVAACRQAALAWTAARPLGVVTAGKI